LIVRATIFRTGLRYVHDPPETSAAVIIDRPARSMAIYLYRSAPAGSTGVEVDNPL
jgi:hypothetical protein